MHDNQAIHSPKVIALRKIEMKQPTNEANEFADLSLEAQELYMQDKIAAQKALLENLNQKNQQMIEKANKQIEAEQAAWLTEKEEEREIAKEEGYAAGYLDGKQIAEDKYADLLVEANQLSQSAVKEYHRIIEKHQQTIITLAHEVAKKIIMQQIDEEPAYFTTIVGKAMEDLKSTPTIEIILHPDDYHLVVEQMSELERIVEQETNLTICMDKELQVGDCILKHSLGQIDVGIDSQLKEIKQALSEKIMEKS